MKKSILCIMLTTILFAVSCATTTEVINEPMVIQRIIDAPWSKDDLYLLANEWMAHAYVASSNVIQYQDKEEGIVVGRAKTNTKYIGLGTYEFWYNMKIEVKDNKARVIIDDVYGEGELLDTKVTVNPINMSKKEYDKLSADFNATIDDLEAHLKKGVEEW